MQGEVSHSLPPTVAAARAREPSSGAAAAQPFQAPAAALAAALAAVALAAAALAAALAAAVAPAAVAPAAAVRPPLPSLRDPG